MIVDTEFHTRDDTAPVPRWEAGAVYDLAIAVVQWDGTVVESQRWLEMHGTLSEAQLAEGRGYLAARPSQLVCCWGSTEFEFFRAAGRKAADGSDGFDVRECILQVLPRMRNLTHADDTCRFSLSINMLTPLFGLRAAPFLTALSERGFSPEGYPLDWNSTATWRVAPCRAARARRPAAVQLRPGLLIRAQICRV